MKYVGSAVVAILVSAGSAIAAPVDLSTWSVEQGPGSQPPGNWALAADNNSVRQTVNSQVSVFYDGASSSQGLALSGSIQVNTSGDDDFVGFVLGMDTGEIDGSAGSVDYWLIDWKQRTQSSGGRVAEAGLALTHVTTATTDELDFWSHSGTGFNEVQRATNLGNTGWVDFQEYTFELTFTETLIEVAVDGVTELSFSAADNGALFQDGGFGFYNYSQGVVDYAGITEEVLPPMDEEPAVIPLPASLPLALAGMAVLGLVRRARRS